ncbi:hypothetical protein [Oceanicoccus sagamiensis]|uniref:Uncharacterized protein n=1 Tax=Oceanicoccus sagamiensis TaxID=716816 RepID=A0A1X9NJ06_9GAMM|nr:hypothetical protein [Oceanicoccus sagamiensis]ARN75469.1 hypothetical protein BST96_15935 [Oceanicoccus sagamiensis]
MSLFSDVVLENADALLSASKSIDFQKILSHDSAEVEKLKGALASLQIDRKRSDESLEQYASKPAGPSGSNESFDSLDDLPPLDDMAMVGSDESVDQAGFEAPFSNKEQIIEALAAEGLDGRAGMVYNSFSDSRTLPFSQAHHRRGVPQFDVVVAPDFAPVSGMHGVFITTSEIMSIILPSDNASADWQILKRKRFSSSEEMIDYLSLISAGFDLP